MTNLIKRVGQLTFVAALLAITAAVASAQGTNQTGTVNLSGTISNFVELTSVGSATLSGNTVAAFPGSTSTPQSGAAGGDPLLVNIDFGEVTLSFHHELTEYVKKHPEYDSVIHKNKSGL